MWAGDPKPKKTEEKKEKPKSFAFWLLTLDLSLTIRSIIKVHNLGKSVEHLPETTPPPPSYHEVIFTSNDKFRPSLSEFEDPPPDYESVRQSVVYKILEEEICKIPKNTKWRFYPL